MSKNQILSRCLLAWVLAFSFLLGNACALQPSDKDWKTSVLTFEDAKAAADRGDAYAQAVVSVYYFYGWQTERNPTEACRFAEKSTDQNNPLGQYMLGASYRSGPVIAFQNDGIALQKKAVPGLKKMAESPYAIEALAAMTVEGKVIPSDPKKGVLLHKKAADMGYGLAQYQYATCARDGVGMDKDPQASQEYAAKSADNKYDPKKGDAKKENQPVGDANKKTVEASESFKQFLEQAEKGNPEAQYTVAVAYAQGVGVAVDTNESYKWLCKAAKQYQPNALTLLGVMYFTGKADKQDSKKGFQLIHEAAEQGSTTAASLLGAMYSNGLGVSKDPAQGALWTKKSDRQGQNEASAYLKQILDYSQEHPGQAIAGIGSKPKEFESGRVSEDKGEPFAKQAKADRVAKEKQEQDRIAKQAEADRVTPASTDTQVVNYDYINEGNGICITKCPDDTSGAVVIPCSINGKPVISIGEHAFFGCHKLTNVTIPSSVTSIGKSAFSCSGLTSVTIPSSVTSIGERAFSVCSDLTSVCIPSSVTSIGRNAFRQTLLTSVTIPSSVSNIPDFAFYWCRSLSSVTLPSSVTSIGDDAFGWNTKLTNVTIPSSVTSIGKDAFTHCKNLSSVRFLGNAPTIGPRVFDDAASGFVVKFNSGASGYTKPTWMGYPVEQINSWSVDSVHTPLHMLARIFEWGVIVAFVCLVIATLRRDMSLASRKEGHVVTSVKRDRGLIFWPARLDPLFILGSIVICYLLLWFFPHAGPAGLLFFFSVAIPLSAFSLAWILLGWITQTKFDIAKRAALSLSSALLLFQFGFEPWRYVIVKVVIWLPLIAFFIRSSSIFAYRAYLFPVVCSLLFSVTRLVGPESLIYLTCRFALNAAIIYLSLRSFLLSKDGSKVDHLSLHRLLDVGKAMIGLRSSLNAPPPPPPPTRWFYLLDGETTGPVVEPELRARATKNGWQPETPVCMEGSNVWTTLGNILPTIQSAPSNCIEEPAIKDPIPDSSQPFLSSHKDHCETDH